MRRSVTKRAGVVLLNPCLSSSTNVSYREIGMAGMEVIIKITAVNARDCVIYGYVSILSQ